jgi:hypothetical protein
MKKQMIKSFKKTQKIGKENKNKKKPTYGGYQSLITNGRHAIMMSLQQAQEPI